MVTREQGQGNREQELREKVAKGLWCCTHPGNCSECPWNKGGTPGCLNDLMKKAESTINDLVYRYEHAEGLWLYCPDDEGRPRWKCSRCGKIVHKDPAEKLYCALCGQRNRKEA